MPRANPPELARRTAPFASCGLPRARRAPPARFRLDSRRERTRRILGRSCRSLAGSGRGPHRTAPAKARGYGSRDGAGLQGDIASSCSKGGTEQGRLRVVHEPSRGGLHGPRRPLATLHSTSTLPSLARFHMTDSPSRPSYSFPFHHGHYQRCCWHRDRRRRPRRASLRFPPPSSARPPRR